MASSGKKAKQKKQKQTMSLQHFLAKDSEDVQAGYSIVTAKRPVIDWAAEAEKEGIDDDDSLDTVYSGKDKYILPSAPLGPNIDMSKVPDSPPYTAFVGGLPYDVEQEDIENFFKKLKIKSIRIPRNTADQQRFRGFGYVEFEDRESLIDALGMNESNFRAGRVKIDVAENQDDPNRRRDKNDRGDRGQRSERLERDWRSAPREEPVRPERSGFRDDSFKEKDRFGDKYSTDRDKYESKGFDRDKHESKGFDRDKYESKGFDRDKYESKGFDRGLSSEREKEYSSTRDRDRSGYSSYRGGSDRAYGGDRDRRGFGGRSGRRDFGSGFRDDDKSDYGGRSTWNSNYNRPGRNRQQEDSYDNEEFEKDAPRERKKLVIQPRTKPLDESNTQIASSAIFGGAKPVDTAAREREIEERLAREQEMARIANENRVREMEREEHHDDRDEQSTSEPHRRSSTGSQVCSPRSSTSVPPSVRSWDGGASGQSETDEEKPEKSPTVTGKPPSPRKEDYKAVPAPPPKENAWSKRASSAQHQVPLSSDDRSRNTDLKSSDEHYNSKRSSSVSSTGSDNDRPPRGSSGEQKPPYPKKDDSYGRRKDDGLYKGRGEPRIRNDRGTTRGTSRGGQRGRGYGDRRSGTDSSADNSYISNASSRYDRPRESDRPKEMPKFVEPEAPSYTSSNKYTQLEDEELA